MARISNAQLPVLHVIAYKAAPAPYPYSIRSVENIISVNTTEDHSSLILFHIIKSTTPATPTPFPHKTHTHIEHVNRKSRTPARNFHQHQRRRSPEERAAKMERRTKQAAATAVVMEMEVVRRSTTRCLPVHTAEPGAAHATDGPSMPRQVRSVRSASG
jgi:hypothetical protein